MSKQDPGKAQTCVLRVNIDCECDGCKTKIRKLFHKIDGVYATSIDVEEGKVTVTGNVDPSVLIRKLEKSGKHAELWGCQKGSDNNKKKNQFDLPNNHFKNLKVGNGKEKKIKQQNQFGDQQIAYQQLIQQIKGSENLKLPFKVKEQKKTVKFNLPGKHDDFSGDCFDADGDFEEHEHDDDFGYGAHKNQEALPIMGNGKAAGKHKRGSAGGGGGKAKKSGGFMAMIGKAIGGKGKAQGNGGGKRVGKASDHNRSGAAGGAAYQVGQFPAPAVAQLVPMMNMNGSNPYQQQQYMGMMNQHRMTNGGGGDLAMYGRQPPVPPPAYHDPVTSMFSDENTNGCIIM